MRQLSIVVMVAAAVAIAGGCASGVDAGGDEGSAENDPPLLDATAGVDDPDLFNVGASTTTTGAPAPGQPDFAATTETADQATAPPAGPAGRKGADGPDGGDLPTALLADAVSTSDLCEVYSALDTLTVSGTDLHDLSHTLDVVAATLRASESFVPDALADSWREMEHELDRARSELAKPHAERQTVVDIFSDTDYAEAHNEIEVWREENCA